MTEPSPITPFADIVADDDRIPNEDVARYEEIEQRIGTGILPPAVWASQMGHPAPTGMPGYPVTWLQYAQARKA